jgi:hypothetical protein
MSAQLSPAGYQQSLSDEYAFKRRRTHANIEDMTLRIMDAAGYPARDHLCFVAAVQAAHGGGRDAEIAFTPFSRAHLTIASLMHLTGSDEAKRKAVYRHIVKLRQRARATGVMLFHVGQDENEKTEYTDFLTPRADEAMQRALRSPLWKTDKREAKREAIEWAVAQLPRVDTKDAGDAGGGKILNLNEYIELRSERELASLENDFDGIEERHGGADDQIAYLDRLYGEARRVIESRRKTYPARRDFTTLAALEDEEQDTAAPSLKRDVLSGNTMWDISDPGLLPDDAPPPAAKEQQKSSTPEVGHGTNPSGGCPVTPNQNSNLKNDSARKMHKRACAMAIRGLRIFPVEVGGKLPLVKEWQKRATSDEEQIWQWWEKWPDANIGLATGRGMMVLDIDPRHGGDASLSRLIEEHGEMPPTLEVRTGGGGMHIYFALPEGVEIRNSAGKLGEGLDIRGDGGFVVAPGSVHASGREYETLKDATLAECPAWTIERLLAKPKPHAPSEAMPRTRTQASDGPPISEGSRNDRMFRIACAIWANGEAAHAADLHALLLETNSRRCFPPLADAEVAQIAANVAGRYAPGVR